MDKPSAERVKQAASLCCAAMVDGVWLSMPERIACALDAAHDSGARSRDDEVARLHADLAQAADALAVATRGMMAMSAESGRPTRELAEARATIAAIRAEERAGIVAYLTGPAGFLEVPPHMAYCDFYAECIAAGAHLPTPESKEPPK